MANRYWVGGSGAWQPGFTSRWSATSGGAGGASVPGSSDDVYFDSNSGSTYTVTVGSTIYCKSLNITKPSGSITIVESGINYLYIYGNIYLSDSTGISITLSAIVIQGASSIDTKGVNLSIGSLTFDTSLTFTLLSDLNIPTCNLNLYRGTLDLSTFKLTCYDFNASNNSIRALTFGENSKLIVSGPSDVFTSTGGTFTITNGTGASIEMSSSSPKTFSGGDRTWPSLINTGTGTLTIAGSNTFGDLEVRAIPSTLTLTHSTTQTITGDVILNGTTDSRITINSTSVGTRATLSKASGSVPATGLNIKDSIATGGATWSATDSIDSGNNTGWIFIASSGSRMFQMF